MFYTEKNIIKNIINIIINRKNVKQIVREDFFCIGSDSKPPTCQGIE